MTGEEFFEICKKRFATLPDEVQLELLKAWSWDELTDEQRAQFEKTARKIHLTFEEFASYEQRVQ